MDKVVITIARQYGSGGRTVAEMLSKELGIYYYDKELIKKASEFSGISEGMFGNVDEKLAGQGAARKLFSTAKKVYNGELLSPEDRDFTKPDNLFNYQARVIEQLADTESCVIVGRCADYILRNRDNVVSVFVHADQDFLVEKAKEKLGMPDQEIKNYIYKTDRERGEYYLRYTGLNWSDARNYDLCLNSGKLGFQKCVDIIKEYIKIRFN